MAPSQRLTEDAFASASASASLLTQTENVHLSDISSFPGGFVKVYRLFLIGEYMFDNFQFMLNLLSLFVEKIDI